MKILVIGLARTGQGIIKAIVDENHDITVIDKSHETVEHMTEKYNVCGYCGSGASKTVLTRAGIADTDIVIASTETDEINLMCCMIAKELGAKHAVAILRNPDFAEEEDFIREKFGISYIINPELDTAKEIAKLISLPVSIKVEAFFSGKTTIAEVPVSNKLPIAGMTLREFRQQNYADILVCAVRRGKEVFVPSGDFILRDGDVVDIISSQEQLKNFCQTLGIIRKPIKSVMMVGCGTIGLYLAKHLCESKIKVKIIEFDKKRCRELLEELPSAEITYGDGVESELLLEEGIKKYDACISLAGADETNLVAAMFAWSCGVKTIITKVVSPSYAEILHGVSIDCTISPSLTAAEKLLKYVRTVENYSRKAPGDIKSIYMLANSNAEALEFSADEDSFPYCNIKFSSPAFKLKPNTLIAAIIRKEEIIIPDGNSFILPGDRAVVITVKENKYNCLRDIIEVSKKK